MKLVQLSDIHWRPLRRHDEYRRAFEDAFADIRQLGPDAIIITGDIVHTKTQGITPELIDILTWWFRAMADICDVHITLGNHDGALTNSHRQDAISPIIGALAHPRLHLYKQSGVYKIQNGINLCVFSIFDEQGWDNVKPIDGDINIATFHGSVAGSQTDIGWVLESDLTVDFFEAYDCCMLGDIHMQQFLGYRNKKPWIGYAGSSVQQDYGEAPGKGYLLWEIRGPRDVDVSFRQIKHDMQFHTVDWKGSLQETIDSVASLPKGSRLRFKTSDAVSRVDVRAAINELTKVHGMSEVIIKDDRSEIVESDKHELDKHDLRNVDVLFSMFKDYIGETAFDATGWATVKDIISRYLSQITLDDSSARNVRWHLKELWFDNLFGYGEGNYIDFSRLEGITGVFGPNRVGKSSIIGAILYTLFNGSDRGSIKNLHIINSRKNFCRAKLTLSVSGVDYMIERQSVRNEQKNGQQNAVTSLNFSEIDSDGNVVRDLNGEQRTDTEKSIRALLGTIDDLMLTGVATQGDINSFINSGAAARDNVMSRFLDLTLFEKMCQMAKDESAGIRAQVEKSPDKDWDAIIIAKGVELEKQSRDALNTDSALVNDRMRLDELRMQLAVVSKSNSVSHADIDKQVKKIAKIINEINDARVEETSVRTKIETNKHEHDELIAELSHIDVVVLHEQLKTIASMKESLSAIRQSKEKETQILENQDKSVKRLLDVPCGDMFPTCKYIKDSHADKKKIDAQRTVVSDIMSKISDIEGKLSLLHPESIENQLSRHARLVKSDAASQLTAVRLTQSLDAVSRRITTLEQSHALETAALAEMESRLSDRETFASMKEQIAGLESNIKMLDEQKIRIAMRMGSLSNEIVKLNEEKETFRALKSKWRLYELFIQASSKKGVPTQVIQSQFPVINAEIARTLQGVVDYTLRFERDADGGTEIYIDYGDNKRLIELGSGMEKMISSLAIRVALQNASSLPRPDFLIIDEGFGTLDDTNIVACNRLLVSLKRLFNDVIVISHIDGIKDIVDNVIEVAGMDKETGVQHSRVIFGQPKK